LVACSSQDAITGDVHRFAIDTITLPTMNAQVDELGDDLDGDGTIDNQLGVVLLGLTATGDATSHGADMLASGAIASSIELQGETTAGVRYDDSEQLRGTLRDGAFASTRTRTTKHDTVVEIHIPGFADADPLVLPLHGVELDLAADGTGLVRGGIPIDDARAIASASVVQMMTDHPTAHLPFARTCDTNHDGTVTPDEVANSALFGAFLVGDTQLFGQPMLSVGFAFHAVPCESGRCSTVAPTDPCHDRVRDGAETDVDCGGTCGACPAGNACSVPADCESAACDAGHCRAPSCTDHVRDGFESDVDCGAACPACAAGKICAVNADCTSQHCSAGAVGTGTCTN